MATNQNVSEKDILWQIYNKIADALSEENTKEDFRNTLREIRDIISKLMY